jgi:hypothetical protein
VADGLGGAAGCCITRRWRCSRGSGSGESGGRGGGGGNSSGKAAAAVPAQAAAAAASPLPLPPAPCPGGPAPGAPAPAPSPPAPSARPPVVLHHVAADEHAGAAQARLAVHRKGARLRLHRVQEVPQDGLGGAGAVREVHLVVYKPSLNEAPGLVHLRMGSSVCGGGGGKGLGCGLAGGRGGGWEGRVPKGAGAQGGGSRERQGQRCRGARPLPPLPPAPKPVLPPHASLTGRAPSC